jgi:hypothetical protein
MKHSEQLEQLAGGLAVAQGQMEGALKTSVNPFYKSRYADLKSVWGACRKPLSDNGLAVVQTVRCEYTGVNADVAALAAAVREQTMPPAVIVTTLLIHVSGQWISEELTMWPKDNTPQAIGSCTSYARRYSLAAMVGVYQADDDAESAEGRKESTSTVAADDPDELNEYLKELVNAIKSDDFTLARQRWNELNIMGTSANVWRVLDTKQKKALRDLLQQTTPATPTQEMVASQEAKESPDA